MTSLPKRRRESLTVHAAGDEPGAGRCRIGAENESLGLRAQPWPAELSKASRWWCRSRGPARPGCRPSMEEKPLSRFKIGVDLLDQLVDRNVAHQLLAVDEKSRCRIDAQLLRGVVANRLDVVEQLLIRQALIEFMLPDAELLGDVLQWRQGLLDDP